MQKLPQQVQDAKDRSDRALELIHSAANPPPQDPQPEPAAPDTSPPADPAAPPAPPIEEGKREDWKAKYLTLQGMFNAEVPRLNTELRQATARITELTNEVAALKAAKPEPAPAPEPSTVLPQVVIDAIGPDAAAALQSIVDERIGKVSADVARQIDPIREQNATIAQTAEQQQAAREHEARGRFMGSLLERVPDWQAIDARDDWRAYLAERDPIARQTRQELLTGAAQDFDLDAVVAIFEAFKAKAGLNKPEPAPEPVKPTAHLEVPSPSGRAAPGAGDKKIYTRKEIAEFYTDVSKGRYTREKATQIEADIVAAQREGRVR